MNARRLCKLRATMSTIESRVETLPEVGIWAYPLRLNFNGIKTLLSMDRHSVGVCEAQKGRIGYVEITTGAICFERILSTPLAGSPDIV